jgi:GntR family transcriptional regulator
MTTRDDGATQPVFPAQRGAGAVPLYLQVCGEIKSGITEGRYPVGSLLPTEVELTAAFGVSRQTIRQAIAALRSDGLVSARKGVGTRVEARDDSRHFMPQTRLQLSEFAEETEMRIDSQEEIAATGRLAADLGCRPGRRWLHLSGLRWRPGQAQPLCWTDIHLDIRLKSALDGVSTVRSALFLLVEARTGERISEIQKTIRPVQLDDVMAARLQSAPGDLALSITRRYFGSGRRLLEHAVQTMPADRYVYTTTLRTDPA